MGLRLILTCVLAGSLVNLSLGEALAKGDVQACQRGCNKRCHGAKNKAKCVALCRRACR